MVGFREDWNMCVSTEDAEVQVGFNLVMIKGFGGKER